MSLSFQPSLTFIWTGLGGESEQNSARELDDILQKGGYHLERTIIQSSRKKTRRKSKETAPPDVEDDNEGYGKTGALVSSCRAHLEALVDDESSAGITSHRASIETESSYSFTKQVISDSIEPTETVTSVKVAASTTLYEHLANENVSTHSNIRT